MTFFNSMTSYSLLALYPSGIPRKEPPSCEAPRQPTGLSYHLSPRKLSYGSFEYARESNGF